MRYAVNVTAWVVAGRWPALPAGGMVELDGRPVQFLDNLFRLPPVRIVVEPVSECETFVANVMVRGE